jgi:hypothetical protein
MLKIKTPYPEKSEYALTDPDLSALHTQLSDITKE